MPKKVVENHEDQVERNEEEVGDSIIQASRAARSLIGSARERDSRKEASGITVNSGVRKAVCMCTVAFMQD